jgi:hypothetical protein
LPIPTGSNYSPEEQPTTSAGKSLGLTVFLDGHMNKVEPMTITSDFNGFRAQITAPGEFPQPSIKGFSIKPGTVCNSIIITPYGN